MAPTLPLARIRQNSQKAFPVRTRLSLAAPTLLAALTACANSGATDGARAESQPTSNGSVRPDAASTAPVWPAPTDDVPGLVAAAGLGLGPMGTAEHYHPQLRVIIDGEQVEVPANIGVDPATGAMSAVHTHENDGTIHIEAHTVGDVFILGQLFTQWGVELTATRIGDVRAEAGSHVGLTSNGEPVAGDPGDLRLAPDQLIVLRLP